MLSAFETNVYGNNFRLYITFRVDFTSTIRYLFSRQESLEGVEYNMTECRYLTKSISEKILRAVKNLDYKR